ncbi:dihydropteroate synthase [Rickettsiales endosymbiont of Trichoplax sp. H2]|uniref:dihydropteroate synthase n=1 Tax=Rickettsiales endosymbiont of Trichoplax sp. H2 TaxID=2021221 RepID=UPI0012B4171B|nr:dihydropteroate synthase [Rickettsiales endosymbiont of Trichoplax sp. H2]MSO13873.1 Folate synthesis bifunctional protein [Rickettsiales endosymbiont of Trichoplax sp. H2]
MTKIIGILNYNDNSFSDGGNYSDLKRAIDRVDELFREGADIVDIGASSTSYNAPLISEDDELRKLTPLLNKINLKNISIDTYHYKTMQYAVKKGASYINDVSGGKDPRVLELVASNSDLNYICMHSLTLPADKAIRVKSIDEIYEWVDNKIEECKRFGIEKERLIIDPGIGFATDTKQTIQLLRDVKELKNFDIKICIGHSRKSFFESITNCEPIERDIETLAASLYLAFNEIDLIRVHNVDMHKRGLNVFNNLLKGCN